MEEVRGLQFMDTKELADALAEADTSDEPITLDDFTNVLRRMHCAMKQTETMYQVADINEDSFEEIEASGPDTAAIKFVDRMFEDGFHFYEKDDAMSIIVKSPAGEVTKWVITATVSVNYIAIESE